MRDLRVLVCGSRDWTDEKTIWRLMNVLRMEIEHLVIIEGCARGADSAAHAWGPADGVEIEHYPADWKTYRKAAGPIRNQQMLDEGRPNLVLAFSEDLSKSKGTSDMVRRARNAGLPVLAFSHRVQATK